MGKASLQIQISGDYNGKAIEKAEKALSNLNLAAARASGGMASSFAKTGDELAALGNTMIHQGEKITAFGTSLTKATAPIAALGVASAKLASDYQDSMAKVYTIMDKASVSTQQMSTDILDLSTSTGRSATELADATYQALSASVSTDKAAGFVADAVKLSKAGFTSTTTAVDTLTTIINAYGKSADDAAHISDVLVQTQNKGKTTVDELGASMGAVIPTAAAYKVDLENLSTAYVALTKQGINTANATTYINGMLTELADTGSTVGGILQEKTGKSFSELMESGYSLGDVLEILNDSVDGDSTAFANLWGNVRAGKGALAIANGGAKDFNAELDGMAKSAGNVDKALEDLATPSTLAAKAINSLKNTGIELGEEILRQVVPSLQSLAEKAQGLYRWFGSLDDGTKRAIVKFGLLVTAAGPLITVFGKLHGAMGTVVANIGHGIQGLASFVAAMKSTETAMAGAGSSTVSLGEKLAGAASKTGLLSKAASVLKGGLAALGIAAAAAAIGIIIAKLVEWTRHMELVSKATTGLEGAVKASDAAYAAYSTGVDKASTSMKSAAAAATEALNAQSALSDKMTSTFAKAGEDAAMVQHYADTIAELGNKGNLTASEQARLTDAVKNFNAMTGSSVAVVDATTGSLNTQTDAILKTAEAYREEARAAAAREMLTEVTKQVIKDELALKAAKDAEREAEEKYMDALRNGKSDLQDRLQDYAKAKRNAEDMTKALNSAKKAESDLANMIGSSVKKYDSFDVALASCGASIEDLGEVSEGTLAAMREAFDGSLNSIVESCVDNGARIPEGVANGIMQASGLPEAQARIMLDALVLQMSGGDVEKAAKVLGHDIDSGLQDGIRGDAELPKAAVGILSDDVIKAAKDKLKSHSPSQVFVQIGKDIDTGLTNGINDGKGGTVNAINAVAAAIVAAGKNIPNQIKSIGSGAGSAMAAGLNAQSAVVKSAGNTLANSAVSGASSANGGMKTAGSGAGATFRDAVGAVSAWWAGNSVAVSARDGANDVSLWWVGNNAAQGFVNGLSATDFWSIGYNMAGMGVRAGLEAALGISSPSKVFAYYGEMAGKGLVIGMQAQEEDVLAEAQRYGDLMALDPLGYDVQGAADRFAGSTIQQHAGAAASGGPVFQVSVNVNGAMDQAAAQQAGAELADAAYRQWRRYERAVA